MIPVERSSSLTSRAAIAVLFLPAFFPYVGVLEGIDTQPNGLLALIVILALTFVHKRIFVRPVYLSLLIATVIVVVVRLIYQLLIGDVSTDASTINLAFAQTGFHLATILVTYLVVSSGV